jgi:putative transposase
MFCKLREQMGTLLKDLAIHIARVYLGRRQNFTNQHFWARGFFVSTVGKDEAVIREYIKTQEKEDHRVDQLNLIE